jgi:hypothetical protein
MCQEPDPVKLNGLVEMGWDQPIFSSYINPLKPSKLMGRVTDGTDLKDIWYLFEIPIAIKLGECERKVRSRDLPPAPTGSIFIAMISNNMSQGCRRSVSHRYAILSIAGKPLEQRSSPVMERQKIPWKREM